MINVTASYYENQTDYTVTNPSVLYYGVNGYGITWGYFLTHLALILVAGAGLFLNTMALKIVHIKSPLSDVSQTCISHLARSDICTSIVCLYLVLYNLVHYKNYFECAFRTGVCTCILLNSSVHLLSLTFDRYFKIMFPYKYVQLFTENKMKVFSVSAWIFSCILGLLPIIGWRQPPTRGINYCSYFGVLEMNYLTVVCILFFTIMFMISFCYISILCVAWSHRRSITCVSKGTKGSYTARNTLSLWWSPTKTIIVLITFYTGCWLPSGRCCLYCQI